MERRLSLHNLLKEVMDGSDNVYFQPPENVSIQYPCIIYGLTRMDPKYSDNRPYLMRTGYTVMHIDRDPESEVPGKIAQMRLCRFDRAYTKDNLNHNVFTLYY